MQRKSSAHEWSDFVLRARTAGDGDVSQSKLSGKALSSHLLTRTAVYAIGPQSGPPSKIGFSGKPVSRLTELQIASPQEVRFHLVCWLADKPAAVALEARCHRLLTTDGLHIRGEWFNVDAVAAAKAVDRASIDIGCIIVPHKDLVKRFRSSQDPLAGYFWP